MNRLLKKNIKINIPYISIQGSATLSKITEMNAVQSRIALMIVCHKELDITNMTLGEAIEKTYGLIPNNQAVIIKDIHEMIDTKTIKLDEKHKKMVLLQKVGILNLKLNKGIKADIISKEKYSLMTSDERIVNKKIAVELFDDMGVIENPVFSKQVDIDIKNEKEYSTPQFKSLIESHISIGKNETLDDILLSSDEGTVGWIKNDLNIEIGRDITAKDNHSEKIIDLLCSGNINVDPQILINEEITKLKLSPTTDNFDVDERNIIEPLIDSNEVVDTKYLINKLGIMKFYEKSFNSSLKGKEISIKEVVTTEVPFIQLFESRGLEFTEEILTQFTHEAKCKFLEAISKGAKTTDLIKKALLGSLSIETFSKLDESPLKLIISSKELFNTYFESNVTKFKSNPELIHKLLNLGYEKEEWLLKHTSYQYIKNRLFEKWKPETKFFKAIENTKIEDLGNYTKDQIQQVIETLKNSIPTQFEKQTVFKDTLSKLLKKKDLAGEWTEDKIIAEGMRLRNSLESFAQQHYEGNNKLDNKSLMEATFKKKYSKEMYSCYRELSNVISHNIKDTTNLYKENIVKKCANKLGNIFDKDIKVLKIEIKKPKKGGNDES